MSDRFVIVNHSVEWQYVLTSRQSDSDPKIDGVMWCLQWHIKPGPTDHDDIIKRKYFPRYWPFVRGIHRPSVYSSHKGQWCGALMFSLICVWRNGWVNIRDAGGLRRHGPHNDVTVMLIVVGLPLPSVSGQARDGTGHIVAHSPDSKDPWIGID